MEKTQSFHDIFMAHLSKNPGTTEENRLNFDHTLYEATTPRHRILHFRNPAGAGKYHSHNVENRQQETVTSHRPPPAPAPAVQEPKITMKHLNTPELLAAASIVTGYLGDSGFLPRTQRELKKAYRKMLLKEHPDHGGDAQRFTDRLHAFRLLLDVAQNLSDQ